MITIHLPKIPLVTTERMVLRELLASDAEAVFSMRSDHKVMRYVPRPMAKTIDDASALIDLVNSRNATNDSVQWAITLKEGDAMIGIIGYWRFEKEQHLAELGYMLHPAHWGQGLVSEAIGAVLKFGFGTLGLHRVEAVTRPENAASIRALEKNGFALEGHFKENLFWEGVFLDSLYFGRLAHPVGGQAT